MGSKHRLARIRRNWDQRIERAQWSADFLEDWMTFNSHDPEYQVLATFGRIAINGWKSHYKTIYEVDPDLLQELLDSEVPDAEIPVDILRRIPHNVPLFILPEPLIIDHEEFRCLYHQFLVIPCRYEIALDYLRSPLGKTELKNLFRQHKVSSIDELPSSVIMKKAVIIDGPESAHEMKFLWFGHNIDDPTDQMITTQTILLDKGDSVDLRQQLETIISDLETQENEGYERVTRDQNWQTIASRQFAVAVALTLYVCSDQPDIVDVKPPMELVRNGMISSSSLDVKNLGIRIGTALRTHRSSTSSGGGEGITRHVMPHVRKAHWHRFWTGPKNGDRKLVVKWLPPIPVNVDKGEVITTVRPVKSA